MTRSVLAALPLVALTAAAFAASPPPLEDPAQALARLDSLRSIVRLEEARVRKAPGNEEGWDRLARAWLQVGDHEKAAKCMERARAMGAYTYDTQLLSGRVARSEGRFGEAIDWLTRATRTRPDDWEAQEDLGVALYLAGRYREAADHWDRARAAPGSASPERRGLIAALRRVHEPAYRITGAGRERLRFVPTTTRGALIVSARIQGRGPFLLRIDMGSPEVVLGRSLATELRLAIESGGETGTFVGDRPVALDYAVIDSVALGGTTLHDLAVAVSDQPNLAGDTDGIRGTLGFEALRRFRFCLDFPDSTLWLAPIAGDTARAASIGTPPAWLPPGRAAHRLPLVIRGTHLLVVSARLGKGPDRPFVLDTGAPGTAVAAPMSTLAEAGIQVDTTRVMTGATAAGPIGYYEFQVPSVCAGSACGDSLIGIYGTFPPRLENNPTFRIAGLLSRGFLGRYRLGIDLSRREAWLIEP